MSAPRDIELALKKQRLQLKSAALRRQTAEHACAFVPVFALADKAGNGITWLRRHPQVLVAAAVAVAVARPRRAFTWARRAFFGWRAWRRLQEWQAQNLQ